MRLILVGAGGHCRVLIDCLRAAGGAELHGILDLDRGRWGESLLGLPVLGGDDLLDGLSKHGVTHFVIAVGGTRDNRSRQGLFKAAQFAGLQAAEVRHPSALISRYAHLAEGCQLLPGCIVNAEARLETHVIVNSAAVVEHDCVIGAHVHVATGARMASGVRVGPLAHIGAGATIRQGISIGARAVVGAGAVVVKDVPEDVVVVGVPARPMA